MDRIASPQMDNYIRNFVKATFRSMKDANQFGWLYKKHTMGMTSNIFFSYMSNNLPIKMEA